MTTVPMKIIIIKRTHYYSDWTAAVIDFEGKVFGVTGELPWKNNQHDISCIPEGEYNCARYISSRFGSTFKVIGVNGRDGILFHWGNVPLKDSKGCILIGESFDPVGDSYGVVTSRSEPGRGFNEFLKLTKDLNEFKLIVKKCD